MTATRNLTLNPEADVTVVQTMAAVANTNDSESMLGSSWVTVTDDMQYFFDNPTAGGMTITPDASGDGTDITGSGQEEVIEIGFRDKTTGIATYVNYTVIPSRRFFNFFYPQRMLRPTRRQAVYRFKRYRK